MTVAKMRAGTVEPTERRVQIAVREVVVGEHLMAVIGKESVDRSVAESIAENGDGIIESALLV
jgi:hypothetical protein